MPKYRQLHTKIVDSFDFAEMPDDFTRVLWLLLIVIVDSEGRGIDSPSWIRARMFPLRPDVDLAHIEAAMEWLTSRGMIARYEVDSRSYFCIPTFRTYQSGTEKEARSTLPPTPDLLQSNSRPTPEQVRVNTIQYNADSMQIQIQDNTTQGKASEPTDSFSLMRQLVERYTGLPIPSTKSEVDAINEMVNLNVQEADVKAALQWFRDNGKTARGASGILNSVKYSLAKRIQSENSNGGKPADKAVWVEDYFAEHPNG